MEIVEGEVISPAPDDVPKGEGCWRAEPSRAFYYWSDVGSFIVESGRRIIFQPTDGVDRTAIRLALLGPLLATVLHQKGALVLHASGVYQEDAAVCFVGPTGSGKSTTASLMLEHGWNLLTDDLLAVYLKAPGGPSAIPGPTVVKLWPEAAEAMGYSPDALPRLGAHYLKRMRHIESGVVTEPVPLRTIYLIERGPAPEIRSIPKREALMALMTQCYCSELLRFCDEEINFLQTATLVRSVEVRRLVRGATLDSIKSFEDAIVRDLDKTIACGNQ